MWERVIPSAFVIARVRRQKNYGGSEHPEIAPVGVIGRSERAVKRNRTSKSHSNNTIQCYQTLLRIKTEVPLFPVDRYNPHTGEIKG